MSFGTMGVDWEERVDYARLRKERLERASKALDESGLGMLLCYDYNNIRYITGHHYGEWGRDKRMFYTILPKGSDHPVFYHFGSRYFVTKKDAPWLAKDIRISKMYALSWITLQEGALGPAINRFIDDIKSVRKQYGVADLPVGVDLPDVYLIRAFQENRIEWEDAWKPMFKARLIKTKDEVELLKISAALGDGMYDAVGRAIRPGMRENEIQAVANHTLYALGADEVVGLNCMSGPRTNPNHHEGTSDRIIRPGDLMFLDTFHGFNGYRTCYYRTFCAGRATKAQKESYRAAHDMMFDAIKKVKPGATTVEVASVWPEPEYWGRKTWEECSDNALGHGIGLSIHEPPSIGKGFGAGLEPFRLQPSMVLAIETWAGPIGGDHGVRLEEEILVTDTGYELLFKFSPHSLVECMGGWYDYSPE